MASWVRITITVIVLLGAVAASVWSLIPRPGGEFPTERAVHHLRQFANDPRPYASPGSRAARAYLVEQLTQLRFHVQLHEQPAIWGAVDVRPVNVIARRNGSGQTGKAIMLAAHYDTVRTGAGASDDGAGVATVLTVAEILSQEQLHNDLIILITDCEEMGLLGARTFIETHPWAKDIGVGLNFEARGASGPSIMYEAGIGNAQIVKHYAQVAPHPVTSSLAGEVYRFMPNKTDFTIFKSAGLQGLNFAYIGDYHHYHQPSDTIENLDQRSLWHHGAQALSLARRLGNIDLSTLAAENDAIYFSVLGAYVVRLPPLLAILLSFATLFAAGALTIRAVRGERGHWKYLLIGLALLVITIIGIGGALFPFQKKLLALKAYHDLVIAAASTASVLVVALPIVALRRRAVLLNASAACFFAVMAVMASIWLPGGSYLPLVSAIACTAALSPIGRRWWGALALAVIVVIVSVPVIVLAADALTTAGTFAVGMIVAIVTWSTLPILLIGTKGTAIETPPLNGRDNYVSSV